MIAASRYLNKNVGIGVVIRAKPGTATEPGVQELYRRAVKHVSVTSLGLRSAGRPIHSRILSDRVCECTHLVDLESVCVRCSLKRE